MGGAFNPITQAIECNGQQVTIRLNQVFRNPGSPRYQKAQANNTFGSIGNVEDNWKDLIIAYLRAGVDVGDEFPAWVAYLQKLGRGATGTQGPLSIYMIAQARNQALLANRGMDTSTHGPGGPVHTTPGSGSGPSSDPATIDSPCPP